MTYIQISSQLNRNASYWPWKACLVNFLVTVVMRCTADSDTN